jgi:hypothetical protein
VPLHQARQQARAEQTHDLLAIPHLKRAEDAIGREAAVAHQDVQVGMPLQEVAARCDRDHDSRPHVLSEVLTDEGAQGLGAGLCALAQQLAAPPEERTQQARDRHHHVSVRDGFQHLLP